MATLPKLRTRFPEPVVTAGADPYVVIHDSYFYYCHVVDDSAVYIRKARSLDGIGKAEAVLAWNPPADLIKPGTIWAPELHRLDGKWYIYVAAGTIKDQYFSEQRMYVLEGDGDDPQTATYTLKGKITDPSDQWAIDGTILELTGGDRYFVWSGWPSSDTRTRPTQNIYIAKMKNPWTLEGERVAIASPIYPWEKIGGGINEGPQVLPQEQTRHIIYSASHSLTDHYCLGQLTLVGDNPLDPTHWIKRPTPIYETRKGLISPGHASFILTPDEKAGWMIFHTARHAGAQWDRQVRLAAFLIRDDGSLKFMPDKNMFDLLKPNPKLVALLKKMLPPPKY